MTVFIESFEDITAGPNSPQFLNFYPYFLVAGYQTTFQFQTGARLVAPIPNDSLSNIVAVANFANGNAFATLDANGTVAAGDVPTGTSYVIHDGPGDFAFGFATNVYTVGAYVDSNDDTSPGIAAYDGTGKLISGAQIRSVPVGDWDTNYIQVISKAPIAKVVFTGTYTVLDNLTFDTAKPHIVKGSGGDDTLAAGPAGASPSNHADLIYGRNGNDRIQAKGGDDTIDGGKGDDKIHAGSGNDTVIGGVGKDKMWGDEGQDSFQFGALGSVDRLKDFNPFDDTILLDHATFSTLALGTPGAAQLRIGPAAADADDGIIYDFATGKLFYDIDGIGPNAPIQFARLPLGLALTVADFLVV